MFSRQPHKVSSEELEFQSAFAGVPGVNEFFRPYPASYAEERAEVSDYRQSLLDAEADAAAAHEVAKEQEFYAEEREREAA